MTLDHIATHLVALVIGLAGGFSLKIAIDRRSDRSHRSTQKGNVVGGDQAGRDIKK